MDSQKILPDGRAKEGRTINLEKDSLQYNAQDMDQHQRVDVNPSQLNTQNLNITIRNSDFSGEISGITCLEGSLEPIPHAEILLYFGTEGKTPVYKTCSDDNGNYAIEDIPPGYYVLSSKSGNFWYKSYHIKVLPGQKVDEPILLRKFDLD